MSEFKNINVQVTTFINPHLLWIFLCEDAQRREKWIKDLQQHVSYPAVIKDAKRGQSVLVHDKVWKRACIKESSVGRYTCWLSDYGVFYTCDKVYKIPDKYKTDPLFIKQVALSDVVNVKQTFEITGIKLTNTIKFCPGTIKYSKDCIEDAQRVFFQCLREQNGIHIGKIEILRRDGHIFDLATTLIKHGTLAIDKELFGEALKENLKIEDLEFFATSVSPCTSRIRKKSSESLQEIVRDIADSKGIGRGTVRGNRLKQVGPTPGNKSFVENWVMDSTKVTPKSDLHYESDDSENMESSPNTTEDSLKSAEKDSSSSSVSPTKSPRRSFDRLKQALLLMKSEQAKNSTSPGSVNSDICSSSSQKKTVNSTQKNISSSDVLRSFLEASKSPTSPPVVAKREPEDVSDTSSISGGLIAILEKKFESKFQTPPGKTEEADVSLVKSTPSAKSTPSGKSTPSAQSPPLAKSTPSVTSPPSAQSTPSVTSPPSQTSIKWPSDSKGTKKSSSLNFIPAGMIPVTPKKKEERKYVSNVCYSGSSSTASELQREKMLRAAVSSSQPSLPGSSASSTTSLQKLNEYARGLSNSQENFKSAVDLLKQNCTQGCMCPQCKEWDTQDLFVDNKQFVDTKSKKKKKAKQKPPLLLKTAENENKEIELKSHSSLKVAATNTERAIAPKIVVHGRTLPFPTTSVSAVPFNAEIHRVLRSFEHVYTIQSYAWPCTMRGNNICMVSAPKSGKTMGYLPGICSYLLDRHERYEELPSHTISPIAIVLCPGSDVADNVQDLMLKLVDHSHNKPACAFAVPPVDKQCLNQFQKQCDMLITTPVVLISLLRTKIITIKRLCHLIIEGGEKILQKFPGEIDSLLNLAQSMMEHRVCGFPLQLIVCSEHWTLQLENLMKRLNLVPVVCVASHLEAALYGRADIQVQFLETKHKSYTLAEFLKDTAANTRTVVICNTDSEIEEVEDHLISAGVNYALMTNAMDKQEVLQIEANWKCTIAGKHLALMCTDQVFNTSLTITDAVVLLHYSLPDTWTLFTNRFSCLLDNYSSPLATKAPTDWVRCKVHIFVDGACTKQFPKLMQFLQRMGKQLPPRFIEYYKHSIKVREEEKLASKMKLCRNLQLFGRCLSDNRQLSQPSVDSETLYSLLNCRKRHIVSSASDYSSSLPKCGVIKFRIIHVHDVTIFTVKILEHTDLDGKVHEWETFENLDQELQKAMAEQKIGVFDVKLGGWYVVYSENDGSYERCLVQKILQVERITKMASHVFIRCLDSGVEKKVLCSTLYDLPKKFQAVPPQGINIILANTVPPDSDDSWSSTAISKVKYTLKDAGYQREVVYGLSQILLQLGNIIWVKNILLRETLHQVNTTVTKLNLRKSLKDQNLVSYSDKPLEGLYDLCKNAGIDLPDISKVSAAGKELENRAKLQVEPQWAYFEDCDCNEIYIACVENPGLFYVRLKKFYGLFDNLQNDIQEAIAKPFYPKDFEVEAGKCYLAKDFGGDDYCRVIVKEIKDNIATCFYVDFGDFANINVADIKFLSDEMILKLPFQAIECRLYGIQPAWDGSEWEETAIKILADYIFEPETDYFRTLYITTCKQEPATATNSQRCAILLVDNWKENKIILINQLLIDCGEAVNIAGEDLDKEFNIPEGYVESDEDLDVEDIEGKELTIEEIQRHAAKYKANNENNENNNQASQSVQDADVSDSNDNEHSWDIVIDEPETFMKLLIGAQVSDQTQVSNQWELPPMRALEFSGHFTPNVTWFQTADLITINIMLPDLNDYTLRVTRNKMLMFKTTYDDKSYCLELQLYDKVQNTFKYKVYGQYLKVLLTKCTQLEWPRLIFSADRMRHIKYDVSRIDVPAEEKKTFLKFSGEDEELDDDGCVIEIGSDEDYSESDVESFGSD